MKYRFEIEQANLHTFSISFSIKASSTQEIFWLADWRPGRYEVAHYAQYIRNISFRSENGHVLTYTKDTVNSWRVYCEDAQEIHVNYVYYAGQLDGGGSWVDDRQVYLNPINFLLYQKDKAHHPCSLELHLPPSYQIACALKTIKQEVFAKSYFEMVDSPLICSAELMHESYQVEETTFHLWAQGLDEEASLQTLTSDFKNFTTAQVSMMGAFPAQAYHFLFQFTPYKFYHGVEHRESTVIVLGPAGEFLSQGFQDNLMGISSHELFHAWNVTRLRPQTFHPYDFSKPVMLSEGFVLEGITTYYGDLFLARSGYFSTEAYLSELTKIIQREADNYGNQHQSIVASSYDLWMDGYKKGIPDKKVSIYTKGAIIALMLDLKLRIESDRSLDDIMRKMWALFGDHFGYTLTDFIKICESKSGLVLTGFFDKYLFGTHAFIGDLHSYLDKVGIELQTSPHPDLLTAHFGAKREGERTIQIAPKSPAAACLSLQDEVISFDSKSGEIHVKRFGEERVFDLKRSNQTYFDVINLHLKHQSSENNLMKKWLKK